jgi:hypothetical protein
MNYLQRYFGYFIFILSGILSLRAQSISTTDQTSSEGQWRPGMVHCNGTPTEIVEVCNPITGRVWMDRNLGASRVATSSTDEAAYGDLYQWGRFGDGHQCRKSDTTSTKVENQKYPPTANSTCSINKRFIALRLFRS